MEMESRILFITLVLSSILSCFGWTFIPVSDIDLISSSDSIILGTVSSKIDGIETDIKGPWTHYEIGISYTLKSSENFQARLRNVKSSRTSYEQSIMVSVIGGKDQESGNTLHVTGAPTFEQGDDVLLFLAHGDTDGAEINQINHFALGAFHKMDIEALDGTSASRLNQILVRATDISGIQDDDAEVSVRKYAEFIRYIVKQVHVGNDAQDSDEIFSYGTTATFGDITGASYPVSRFNTFKYMTKTIRWRSFDSDPTGNVTWSSLESGQIGLNGGGAIEIRQAMSAWNAQPNTPINYLEGPETDALTAFFKSDKINSILFEDPKNVIAGKYQCGVGGTLALGGWWTNSVDYTFRGVEFTEIVEADVVLQDGIGCWFTTQTNPSASFSNLITHELGHTLGLDHSCGDHSGNCVDGSDADNAVMRAFVHNNAGAFLASDDNLGIEYIYSECYPFCPVTEDPEIPSEIAVETPDRRILGLSTKHSAIIGAMAGFIVLVVIAIIATIIVIKRRKQAQREQVRSRSSSLIIDPYDHIDIPGYVVTAQTYISPIRMSYYDNFAAATNLKLNNPKDDQNLATSSYRRPYSVNLTLQLQDQNQGLDQGVIRSLTDGDLNSHL